MAVETRNLGLVDRNPPATDIVKCLKSYHPAFRVDLDNGEIIQHSCNAAQVWKEAFMFTLAEVTLGDARVQSIMQLMGMLFEDYLAALLSPSSHPILLKIKEIGSLWNLKLDNLE